MMTAHLAIALAAKHANTGAMASSAALRLKDARSQWAQGLERNTYFAARDSLRYSVGIFHPDFKAVDQAARMGWL